MFEILAKVSPLAMGLLSGGFAAMFIGVLGNLYRFYREEKEKIVYMEDYFLWGGILMIAVSIIIAFIY